MTNLMVTVFLFFGIALMVWILRTTYVAFFKHKDEREKSIVTHSAAQAFVVILLVRLADSLLRLRYYEWWTTFLLRLDQRIHIEPFIGCILLLGIFLFINGRRSTAGLVDAE